MQSQPYEMAPRRMGIFRDRVTEALLIAHKEECREDRARTERQFEAVRDTMHAFQIEFRQRFSELIDVDNKRHDANVGEIGGMKKDIAGIKWYIAAAAGGFAVLMFFADHWTSIAEILGKSQ